LKSPLGGSLLVIAAARDGRGTPAAPRRRGLVRLSLILNILNGAFSCLVALWLFFSEKNVGMMLNETDNESSLFNYTTLSDPFEFKGSTWAEVIVGHGRE
jgi:hypothetical protein